MTPKTAKGWQTISRQTRRRTLSSLHPPSVSHKYYELFILISFAECEYECYPVVCFLLFAPAWKCMNDIQMMWMRRNTHTVTWRKILCVWAKLWRFNGIHRWLGWLEWLHVNNRMLCILQWLNCEMAAFISSGVTASQVNMSSFECFAARRTTTMSIECREVAVDKFFVFFYQIFNPESFNWIWWSPVVYVSSIQIQLEVEFHTIN